MKKEKNSVAIFTLALGLVEPWFVEEVDFVKIADSSTKVLNIHINFHRGHV